jgi:hypothetical protein
VASTDELEEIFDRPVTFGDSGALDCVWNVDSGVGVEYTPLNRIPGQGKQLFRDQRRQAPGEIRDVNLGDDAYYYELTRAGPDGASLNVREGDFIFIVSVTGPDASDFRRWLVELARIALDRGGPGHSFDDLP